MSIGKKSIARAAKAAAKTADEVKTEVMEPVQNETIEEPVTETAAPQCQNQENFKNVQVGDNMPSFLL